MSQFEICKCRCCNSVLPQNALITLKDMPKSAQDFPTKETLKNDFGVDLKLFCCEYCGTIQLSGEPVSYYRDVIRAVGVSLDMKKFRLKQFNSWVERNSLADKKVLEVGCGTGEYLEIMAKTGVIAYGIENNPESVKKAVDNGLNVCQGFVEDESIKLDAMPYDAFYILNFLEHIPNPQNFLRGISANLTDNAVGLIEVPNMDMILNENLYSELIQDHLLYFTEDTLKRFLECNGFEVLRCYTILDNYVLSAEIKKRTPTDINGFIENRKSLQASVNSFFEKMKLRGIKIAVWGAGHQALANMSLLDMKNHITCVLDSALFKQNKFTPVTHLPIFSPEILKEKEIGAVLIMGGSYSKEINEIMKQKYPHVIRAIMTAQGIEWDDENNSVLNEGIKSNEVI